nr:hypothetical protein [Pyrinomonadaceae bacterium]
RSRSDATTPVAPCTGTAIAANFTLTNPAMITVNNNPDGTLNNVVATGGGWGHNTGMSQYGAHGHGLAGQTFLQILKHYYRGVDIGTYPISVKRNEGSYADPDMQSFSAPSGHATLVVRARTDFNKFSVTVNGNHFYVGKFQLVGGKYERDISQYLVPGINTVIFKPFVRHGPATYNINVY